MAKTNKIKFDIEAVVNGQKSVGTMTASLNQLDRVVQRTKASIGAITFASVAQGAESVSNSITSFVSSVRGLTEAYAAQVEGERMLETVMHNTIGASAAQIQSIKDLCAAQQELGVIGDEVQLQGAQELATYVTKTETLQKLIPVMNDMVAQQYGLAASGENAASIATMLGKVMDGQTKALSRYGYTFTEAQEQILKFGDESQRAATLAEVVSASVGGMNAALAQTDAGRQKQLENTLGDIKEQLGAIASKVQPYLTMVATTATAVTGIVKLVAGIKSMTLAAKAWNVTGIASSAVTKTLGVNARSTSVLALGLRNSLHLTSTAAKVAAVSLRGLMIASGVGAVIWALSAALDYFINRSEAATDSTDDLIDAQKRAEREAESIAAAQREEPRALVQARSALEINILKLKEFNGTKSEEKRLVDEMNDTYGGTMGYFSSVSDWYDTLIANSEAYCKQMVLEARTRMLANQIAQKQQENYDITHNEDGSKRKYSTQRQTYQTDQKVQGYDASGNVIWTPGITKEIEGTSDLDKAQAAYDANKAAIEALTGQMERSASELNSISFAVTGSTIRPDDTKTAGSTSSATDNITKYHEEITCLQDIKDNITVLEKEKQTANRERVAEINKELSLLNSQKEEWETLGQVRTDKYHEEITCLQDIDDNLSVVHERMKTASQSEVSKLTEVEASLQRQRSQWLGVADEADKADEAINQNAKTYSEITNNIAILDARIQNATVDEAAAINQQKAYWEDLAQAIRDAGKETENTYAKVKNGWGSIKGLANGVRDLASAWDGNKTVLDATITTVDSMITVYEGVNAVKGIIDGLTASTVLHKTATIASTAATTAETTAEAASAAAAPAQVAADAALVAANKSATASFVELATAAYLAAHASIPFAGFAIGAGFSAAAQALTIEAGIPKYADGGIAYGPTLGVFGEYAGASHNPEVVAPLDKLRDLIGDDGGSIGGNVTFEIGYDKLIGVLKKGNSKYSRV